MTESASEDNSLGRLPGIYLRGMAMGAADVVPGVSGGTLALITGIYEELIDTLGGIGLPLLRVWRQQGFKAMWQAGNFSFLVTLLFGIATSIVLLASALTWLMAHFPVPLWSFFCGLIAASLLLVLSMVRGRHPLLLLSFVVGCIAAAVIAFLPGLSAGQADPWAFFLAGAIAICAMILPGISGSFILLLLGMYQLILTAVHDRELLLVLSFIVGCAIGLLSFVRLLKFLLHRFHDPLMSLLAGFMAGSLVKLWPWRIAEEGALVEQPVLPETYAAFYDQPSMVPAAVLACLAAGVLVLLLSRFQPTHNDYITERLD